MTVTAAAAEARLVLLPSDTDALCMEAAGEVGAAQEQGCPVGVAAHMGAAGSKPDLRISLLQVGSRYKATEAFGVGVWSDPE